MTLHAGTAGFPRITAVWLEGVLHNNMIEMFMVKRKKKKRPNKLIKEYMRFQQHMTVIPACAHRLLCMALVSPVPFTR